MVLPVLVEFMLLCRLLYNFLKLLQDKFLSLGIKVHPDFIVYFLGPTGAGKTTFISEYSLDLCMSGVSKRYLL